MNHVARIAAFLGALVALLLPITSWAQPLTPLEATAVLEELRATSSPSLRTVEQGGRLTFVGGLDEPADEVDTQLAARSFLRRHAPLAGIAATDDLALRSSMTSGETTFVRFDQRYQGRRVIGSQIIVSLRDGSVRHVATGARPWQRALTGRTLEEDRARAIVEAETGLPTGSHAELAWLRLGEELTPVWVVQLREAAPARDWRYIVDALSGALLWRHDQYMRSEGYVYDPSPASGELTRVELRRLLGQDVLEGSRANAFQCVGETGDCDSWDGECVTCGQRDHYAVAQEDGNFLYEPNEPDLEDPFAEVQAYYHADLVASWFEETLGYSRSCRGEQAIDVHVNYHVPGAPEDSANAFYGDASGDGCGDITLGEGRNYYPPFVTRDLAYDADVLYHEYTHGVVEAAGGLGCGWIGACYDELGVDWTAVGLNEGYADYFAVSITDDPVLGEHAGEALSEGEGMVRNAGNDHLCPFDLVGESHYDGQIFSGAAWDIRQALGADVADRVLYGTLLSLTEDSGYAEAGEGILEAVRAEVQAGTITDDDLTEVESILGPEGRGITGCQRIIPLDAVPEGHAEEHMMLYTWHGSFVSGLHWSLTTPRRATRLTFGMNDHYGSAGPLIVHVRKGAPVGVILGARMSVTYEDDFEVRIDNGPLELTPESDPPIEDETTYYFVVEYICNNGCLLRAEGGVEGIPNDLPTVDVGPDLEVYVDETVTLDGSGAADAQGDELTFLWSVLDGPEVVFEEAQEPELAFTPTEPGDYLVELAVTDEEGGTGRDEVLVRVLPVVFNVGGGGPSCGCRTAEPSGTPGFLATALRALLQ